MHGKYHPKPRVSLSPALPAGIESTQEFVQIEAEGIEDIDRLMMEKIDSHLPRGMRILEVARGKMDSTAGPFTYLLVVRQKGHGDGSVPRAGKAGEGVFRLWQGKNVKELWLSGRYSRIVKVDQKRVLTGGKMRIPMMTTDEGSEEDHERKLDVLQ
jgi:hypothetical protein